MFTLCKREVENAQEDDPCSRPCSRRRRSGVCRRPEGTEGGNVDEDDRHFPPRDSGGHGRLPPLGRHRDGLLQGPGSGRCDGAGPDGLVRVHEVRRPEEGRHRLPVAGHTDRQRRYGHGCHYGLRDDGRPGFRLCGAEGQPDKERQGSGGQDLLGGRRGLAGHSRSDARRERSGPQISHIRGGGGAVGPDGLRRGKRMLPSPGRDCGRSGTRRG